MPRTLLIPLLAVTFVACAGSKQVGSSGASTLPASTLTRDSALAMMKRLEAAPLAAGATVERGRAFEWLASSEEMAGISIDGKYLKPLEESDYPFAGELLMQLAFGMAMHRMSAEGAASEHVDQVEAGLRSVIAAYRNMVQADVKLGDKFLDDLDQIRRLGRLREYIEKVDAQER